MAIRYTRLLSELDQQELPNAGLLEPHCRLHSPGRPGFGAYLWGTVGMGTIGGDATERDSGRFWPAYKGGSAC